MAKTVKQLSDIRPKRLAEFFQFLDALRESGVTNMFGASPYLVSAYPSLSDAMGRAVVQAWMHSFSKTPALERANAALTAAA